MICKAILAVVCRIYLNGCVSQIVSLDEHTKAWIGRNVNDMKGIMSRPGSYASRVHWRESTYKLPNGNMVFVEPEPHCLIHWEINTQEIIVGYRAEGERCD